MSLVCITLYKVPSTRCPNKHHKNFYNNKTLVQIKIEQLLNAGVNHIYISTNDSNVKNTKNVTYIQREEKFCNETETTFLEVVNEILNSVPISNDTDVLWTLLMNPLFARYDEMYKRYQTTNRNQFAVYPSKHFYLNKNKVGMNFMFGHWQSYSQGIEPMYQMPNCGTIAKLKDFKETGYFVPANYDFFEIETFENMDIDTEEEFEVAQLLYEWKIKNKKI